MFFRDDHAFLSNFQSIEISVFGMTFPTTEHAYQAQKVFDPDDQILIRDHPKKGLKEFVRGFTIRPDWEEIKDDVMAEVIRAKFKDPEMRSLLLGVDEKIIEHNTWHDNYWGDCVCVECWDTEGLNKLGKLIQSLSYDIIQGTF